MGYAGGMEKCYTESGIVTGFRRPMTRLPHEPLRSSSRVSSPEQHTDSYRHIVRGYALRSGDPGTAQWNEGWEPDLVQIQIERRKIH